MDASFRLRCESALTHPVTIGALGALLVNDVLLKALWPHPWTTGKLSDLAWVVFASPLLAFLLSFLTRGNRRAEWAALAVAYVGLPALYAAFNTFQPVHDSILWALSLAGGSGVGSPVDPADSVVIPAGLGVAWWVWRRSPAGASSLRVRLGMLTAAVAALATVATSPPFSEWGITGVGTVSDGTVVASVKSEEGMHSTEVGIYWVSDDGGMTWTEPSERFRQDESFVPGGGSAETPRGTYSIEGVDIVRMLGGRREIAYSAAYLREAANINLQGHDTRGMGPRKITTAPYSIAYDHRSGNVIVAMGLQGVAVGTPDGRWVRAGVGSFIPSDFSVLRKFLLLLDWELLLMATALALSFTALDMTILDKSSAQRELTPGRVTRVVFSIIPAVILAIPITFIGELLLGFLLSGIRETEWYATNWEWKVLLALLLLTTAALATVSYRILGVVLLNTLHRVFSILALVAGSVSMFSFSTYENHHRFVTSEVSWFTITVSIIAIAMAVPVIASTYGTLSSAPKPVEGGKLASVFVSAGPWRLWAVVMASLAVKLGLIGLSFLLWWQVGLGALAAKVSAVVLVALVTVVLARGR